MSGAWRLPEAADAQSTFFSHALALAALHGPGPWPDGGYPLPDEDPAREQLEPTVGVEHPESRDARRGAASG